MKSQIAIGTAVAAVVAVSAVVVVNELRAMKGVCDTALKTAVNSVALSQTAKSEAVKAHMRLNDYDKRLNRLMSREHTRVQTSFDGDDTARPSSRS